MADRPTVLLVEPDPNLSESLSAFLSRRGYQCLRAASIDEALNVIQIVVPPLRERVEEIPGLIDYFVKVYSKPSVVERLVQQRYPGNVRQLENLIKRMIVLGDPLTRVPGLEREQAAEAPAPAGIGAGVLPDLSLKEIGRKAALAAERDAIWAVLEHTAWNRVRAAKALRISYRALLYKMKQVGLTRERAFDAVGQQGNSAGKPRIGLDTSWTPRLNANSSR